MYNKIAILVPVTSNKCNFKKFKDTDLYEYLFKSFFTTYNQDLDNTIYLGIDHDDSFYLKPKIINDIKNYVGVMKNTKIVMKYYNTEKGDVSDIWNNLYRDAYNDNNDYFVQIGSDVQIIDKGWCSYGIERLLLNDNIGVVGFTDQGRQNMCPQDRLFTQTMVSRKHMDIFGFYFPPELKNWFIDDWLTGIYRQYNCDYLIGHRIYNLGGCPRYEIFGDKNLCNDLIVKYFDCISDYISRPFPERHTSEQTIKKLTEFGFNCSF